MPKVSNGAIYTVYLIVLMDMLNFGIVFPLLPSIAEHFGANATQVGSLATAFSVAQVICTPLLGRASDAFGRRPVLLIAVLGTTLSTALTGFAWTFNVMLVARAINGASGGTVGIANAYIADVCSGDEKPVYISYLQACNSIGIIVGPALGGALSHFGFSVACYVSAALSGLNFFIGLCFLTDSRGSAREVTEALTSQTQVADAAGDGGVLQAERTSSRLAPPANPALQQRQSSVDTGADYVPWSAGLLFGAGFLFMLGFASFESVTGYYLMDMLRNLYSVTMFIMAICVYKPMILRIGENPTVAIGGILRALGFMGMSFAPSPGWFAAAAILQISGGNLISPTTSSLLTTLCSKKIYGKALGYQQSFQAIARIFAPTLFGYLYDHYDKRATFWINAATSLLAVPMIVAVPRPRVTVSAAEVEENCDCMERQRSIPATLDGTPHHGNLRRQISAQGSNCNQASMQPVQGGA